MQIIRNSHDLLGKIRNIAEFHFKLYIHFGPCTFDFSVHTDHATKMFFLCLFKRLVGSELLHPIADKIYFTLLEDG